MHRRRQNQDTFQSDLNKLGGEPVGRSMGGFLWLFAIAAAVFLISTVFDRDSFPIAGLTAAAVVIIGIIVARPRMDVIVLACLVSISLWAFLQFLVFGASLAAVGRMVGVMTLAYVIGGLPFRQNLVLVQLVSVVVATAMLAGPYYLGMYYLDGEGRWNFLGKSVNILALYLVAGAVGCLFVLFYSHLKTGLTSTLLRLFAAGVLLMTLLPVVATGSRKGALLMILGPSLFLLFRMRLGKASLAFIMTSAFAVLVLPMLGSLLDLEILDTLVYRFTDTWESGVDHRVALIENGIFASKQKPWFGHGLDAPYSGQWLAEFIEYDSVTDIGISTHNAYVNYSIMGGMPIFALFVVLYSSVGLRLLREYGRVSTQSERDLVAIGITFLFLFLYGLAGGADFWKLGWWMFGFAVWVSGALRQSHDQTNQRPVVGGEGTLVNDLLSVRSERPLFAGRKRRVE